MHLLPYRTNWLALIALALFFLAVFGYTYFEARNIIYGPSISLSTVSQRIVYEKMVLIRGVAKNIIEIRMNGRTISTTEDGLFEEAHLLAPGYNKILLVARDKIGRVKEEVVELVYKPRDARGVVDDYEISI